jgi:phosphopantetheinyl transferase (holo-ACP synthase)
MNQDDIMRIAREAGASEPESLFGRTDYIVMTRYELERFANIVYAAGATAAREACAKACDEASHPIYIAEVTMPDLDEQNRAYPWFIASEIRARGNK